VPAEIISTILPTININDKPLIKQLLTGKPLFKRDVKLSSDINDRFCIFNNDKFIGIYHSVNEGEIMARPEFVFN
jgi:hypothetical protein